MTSHTTAPAAPEPRCFTFQQDHPVRVVEREGEPWFIAADVCAVLGIVNTSDALKSLDSDERMTLASTEGHSGQRGGARSYNIISESGLYTLILRCRDATTPGTVAHRFRKWVTAEVLPAIRRTGRYGVPAAPLDRTAEDSSPLTQRQRKELRGAVHAYARAAHGGQLRDVRLSSEYQYLYRRLHRHFGVNEYRDIPSVRFHEALDLLRPSSQERTVAAPMKSSVVSELRSLLLATCTDLSSIRDLASASIAMIEDACADSGVNTQAA